MAKIDAGKYGYAYSDFESTFNDARDNGSAVGNQPVGSSTLVSQFFRDSGKGTNYKINRFFCAFDTSSYSSGYTISNLTFNFRRTTSTTCTPTVCFPTFIVVKSTAQGSADTNLAVSDFYSSVDFNTAYSSSTSLTSANADTSISLNSTAITDFGTGLLKIVMVQYGNDYSDTGGSEDSTQKAYANFATSGTGYVPFLEFDAVAGYSNDVMGVSSSNIGSVTTVATASIGTIIGV
tara:strand:- start:29 stop:733 length:705 start_codon:yes stop_codon:yes gene_type:complete